MIITKLNSMLSLNIALSVHIPYERALNRIVYNTYGFHCIIRFYELNALLFMHILLANRSFGDVHVV